MGFIGVKDEIEILLDLVAISSVSSVSNQPVIDYVSKRLHPALWKIKLYPYRDPKGVAKVNLVAITRGPTARRVNPEDYHSTRYRPRFEHISGPYMPQP